MSIASKALTVVAAALAIFSTPAFVGLNPPPLNSPALDAAIAARMAAVSPPTALFGNEILPCAQAGGTLGCTVSQLSNTMFKNMTTTAIADVVNRTCAVDQAPTINAQISAGLPVILSDGCWGVGSPILGRTNGPTIIKGQGQSTEIRALTTMSAVFYRAGVDAGASKDQTQLSDVYLNANRLANYGFRIGAGKSGLVQNVRSSNFLIGCGSVGDDSGVVEARYYENNITHVICDGGSANATSLTTEPLYGLVMTESATDNPVFDIVPSYVQDTGVYIRGGGNTIDTPHCYGPDILYCVRTSARTDIANMYADSVVTAGVQIAGPSVTVSNSHVYWPTTGTPAFGTVVASSSANTLTVTASPTVPITRGMTIINTNFGGSHITGQLTGTTGDIGTYSLDIPLTFGSRTVTLTGAVPYESLNGIDQFSITGGIARGGNAGNPSLRWMGTTRPLRITNFGHVPCFVMNGDNACNTVERFLGVSNSTNQQSSIVEDTYPAYRGYFGLSVNRQSRWRLSTDGVVESGSNVGSSFILYGTQDDGTEIKAMQVDRLLNMSLYGSISLTTSGGKFGAFGTTPVAAKTGWALPTGTLLRSGYTTYNAGTTLTYSSTYTQSEQTAAATRIAALEAQVQSLSQTLAALITDLHSTAGYGWLRP